MVHRVLSFTHNSSVPTFTYVWNAKRRNPVVQVYTRSGIMFQAKALKYQPRPLYFLVHVINSESIAGHKRASLVPRPRPHKFLFPPCVRAGSGHETTREHKQGMLWAFHRNACLRILCALLKQQHV